MNHMFSYCESLTSLPDISKWKTNKVTNMNEMFSYCYSLSSLPDISKWNTINVNNTMKIISNCILLLIIPNLSKVNVNKRSNKIPRFSRYLFFIIKRPHNFPTNITTNKIIIFNLTKIKYITFILYKII